MAGTRTIRLAVIILGISLFAVAQDDTSSDRPAPAPAFGQTAPVLDPDNPPISGLDEPGLQMRAVARSFFSAGLSASESANTNANNQLGGRGLSSVTHLLGALDLQRFYPKSDIFAEYLGGGAFYSNSPNNARQLHALGLLAVTRWRTGHLTLRDAFSYLPEGSFSVGAYGGTPGLGVATEGISMGGPGGGLPGSHSFGNGSFGAVGLIPRLANTAIVDVVQSLTPRSAVTVATGFSNAHFFDNTETLINSDQVTVQAGYSYMLGRRDQVAGVYAFQQFRFPQDAGGQIDNHIVNLRWGRVISGRLRLIAGAGPQYTTIQIPGFGSANRWSVNGRVSLHYKFPRTSVGVAYEKFTSAGSGFFAGADTQVARIVMNRPLGRTWEGFLDVGYARSRHLQQFVFLGSSANRFDHGFAGAILRKHIGRTYSAFAAYRFGEVAFDKSICDGSNCGRISQRHIGAIGVEWHPRPIRIE
jgi:hypothetical protein